MIPVFLLALGPLMAVGLANISPEEMKDYEKIFAGFAFTFFLLAQLIPLSIGSIISKQWGIVISILGPILLAIAIAAIFPKYFLKIEAALTVIVAGFFGEVSIVLMTCTVLGLCSATLATSKHWIHEERIHSHPQLWREAGKFFAIAMIAIPFLL